MSTSNIGHSLSSWMANLPKFQVFRSVIVSYTVLMMHVFRRFKRSTEHLFHDNSVLKYLISVPVLSKNNIAAAVYRDRNLHGYSSALPRTKFGAIRARHRHFESLRTRLANLNGPFSSPKTVNVSGALLGTVHVLSASSLFEEWSRTVNASIG